MRKPRVNIKVLIRILIEERAKSLHVDGCMAHRPTMCGMISATACCKLEQVISITVFAVGTTVYLCKWDNRHTGIYGQLACRYMRINIILILSDIYTRGRCGGVRHGISE